MSKPDNYYKVHLSGKARGIDAIDAIFPFCGTDPDGARKALRAARDCVTEVSRPGHTAALSVWRGAVVVPASIRIVGITPEVAGADLSAAAS